ncbi:MAG TPA: hypothetical protein VGH37_07525 [Candidatus Acidoferrum sp.]|jgi:hypothetical protein
MTSKSFVRSFVLFSAVALATVPVFAKPVTKTIPINHKVIVGSSDVKQGEYRFVIDGNHLSIMNGKKSVAESDGKWEDRDTKSEYTEIVSNGDGKVVELRFAGQKSVFVLAQ